MAVTVTPVPALTGPNSECYDITWALDADVTGAINHGLGEVPWDVIITRSADNPARLYEDLTKRTNAQVQIKKDTGAGSGGMTARVRILRPHSVVR